MLVMAPKLSPEFHITATNLNPDFLERRLFDYKDKPCTCTMVLFVLTETSEIYKLVNQG